MTEQSCERGTSNTPEAYWPALRRIWDWDGTKSETNTPAAAPTLVKISVQYTYIWEYFIIVLGKEKHGQD